MQDDKNLTEQIIGAAIEVHKVLGPGLLESLYESALCYELQLRSIPFERQFEINVFYKGQSLGGQKVDILVDKRVVIELKSVKSLSAVATAQTLSYLKATGHAGESKLVDGIKRISL